MAKKQPTKKEYLRAEIEVLTMVVAALEQQVENYRRQREAAQGELDEIEFQECIRK